MAWRKSIPNFLTWSRVAAVPLLIGAFYLPGQTAYWATSLIFVCAAITDFFDGYLARRWQAATCAGQILDPIADKMLVAAALLPLVAAGRADGLAVLIILLREIFVSGLREQLQSRSVVIPVSRLAKWKTAAQMTAIISLLLAPLCPFAAWIGPPALWIAAALTLISAAKYCRIAFGKTMPGE